MIRNRLLQKAAQLSLLQKSSNDESGGRRMRPPLCVLELRLGGDWKSPAVAKCFGGNFDSRSSLLPLVFAALYHTNYPAHQFRIEIGHACDLLDRRRLFNIIFKNGIEHVIV